jgi:mannitol/fructose-specific phosphotransferase system IIA component (Ntr-type)
MAERKRETQEDPDIIGLSELLDPALMRLDLQADDRWQAIEILVDDIIAAGALPPEDRDAVVAALFGREGRSPGDLKNGVAMPAVPIDRAQTNGVTGPPRIIVAVGRCVAGVDYHARDRMPVTIFFLTLIPRSRFKPVLEAMREQDFLYHDGTLAKQLMAADSKDAFVEHIERAESRLHNLGFDT